MIINTFLELRLVAILKAIQDTSIKVTVKLFCQSMSYLCEFWNDVIFSPECVGKVSQMLLHIPWHTLWYSYSLEDLPSTIVMILQIIVNMISGNDKFQGK